MRRQYQNLLADEYTTLATNLSEFFPILTREYYLGGLSLRSEDAPLCLPEKAYHLFYSKQVGGAHSALLLLTLACRVFSCHYPALFLVYSNNVAISVPLHTPAHLHLFR